jgi:glycosyltransferase involved in cell wall biosynthesis
MTSDILFSWKTFVDRLESQSGHRKATLLLHTDPLDPEGTNLFSVIDMLGIGPNVVFSKERIGFNEMKVIYNISDTIVNRSTNEGFGLPTLEMMMCGKPIIALKTGGLTRQVEDPDTGEHYGIGLNPEVRTIVGNHMVPYIYEDFVSHETLTKAFMQMYEMGPDAREILGKKAMERARREYNLDKVIKDWDESLTKTIEEFNSPTHKNWSLTEL